MFDQNGMCSKFLGFLWKKDCLQASCPTSKNYIKPKGVAPIGTYNNGQGYVYVVTTNQLHLMDDCERNAVVVVDKRNSSDPNMQIQNSYRIKNRRQQGEICQLMLDYNAANPVNPEWSRTKDSLVEEWRLHNLAYSFNYQRERTRDCDFNNADEGVQFLDFAGGYNYAQ